MLGSSKASASISILISAQSHAVGPPQEINATEVIIDTKINGVESKMLFQEKPAKELLQFNLRKNGPIFEGDE